MARRYAIERTRSKYLSDSICKSQGYWEAICVDTCIILKFCQGQDILQHYLDLRSTTAYAYRQEWEFPVRCMSESWDKPRVHK